MADNPTANTRMSKYWGGHKRLNPVGCAANVVHDLLRSNDQRGVPLLFFGQHAGVSSYLISQPIFLAATAMILWCHVKRRYKEIEETNSRPIQFSSLRQKYDIRRTELFCTKDLLMGLPSSEDGKLIQR